MIGLLAGHLALIISAPCEEMIDLSGPSELVAAVKKHLSASKDQSCRKLAVALKETEKGIDVALAVDGMIVNRIASTPEIAAVLIEAWAAPDGPRQIIRPRNEWIAPKTGPAATVEIQKERSRLLRLATDGELSIASDGSIWYGPAAHVCMILSYFCAGGELRYAHSSDPGGTNVDGNHVEAQARIEGRIEVAMFTIESRLGGGISHTSRTSYRTYLGPCERFDCSQPAAQQRARTGLSVSAGLGATYHATPWLGIALGLSISSGPMTRDAATRDPGMWFFRIGLGLEIEV